MPQLRKRSLAVTYAESGDDEAEKPLKRRRTVKARRQPDSDDDSDCDFKPLSLTHARVSASSSGDAAALSESGSDSDMETKRPPPRRAPVRARRSNGVGRKAFKKEEEFDWSAVVAETKEESSVVKKEEVEEEEDDEDDEDEEWEDVGEAEEATEEKEASGGIDITLNPSSQPSRKKKGAPDLEAEFRREIARQRKEAHEDMHTVHLLCLLAHGRRLSAACDKPEVAATALSLLPETPPNVQRLLTAAGNLLVATRDSRAPEAVEEEVGDQLRDVLESGHAGSEKFLVLGHCALMRAAGLRVRLVHALQPVSLKPPGEKSKATVKKKGKPTGKRVKMEEDEDFKPEKGRRRLVSEEEEEGPTKSAWWLEVLQEQRWVCVDVINANVDRPDDMELKGHPTGPTYVVAFEGCSCRDVTARYNARWCVHTRKLRLPSDAWETALMAKLGRGEKLLEAREDDEIREKLLQLPPPKSTGDFNNHPLYAMTRHLKKYEVIYPPDALTLFFHKGEPVFPRENVRTCHTRETWLKEARTVKVGEEPAKIVISRTTSKQRVLLADGRAEIELFGLWQTQEYDPPHAQDGFVPKNEHGNVDLFQPCMLPRGCAHLRLPGLGRIARRLEIDVAQAMVGWEFHAGRWAHPVFDGWVVCREHVSVLSHAWLEAERHQQEKAAKQRTARAEGNWRLLVRGLLIRKRLSARYNLSGSAKASRVSSIAEGMRQRKDV